MPSEHHIADIPKRLLPVLDLVLQGRRNHQIACQLCLTRHTVENYVSQLLDIFGCASRAELIVAVLGRGGHASGECARRGGGGSTDP